MITAIVLQLQFLMTTLFCAALSMGIGGCALLVDQDAFRSLSLGILGAVGILGVGTLSLLFNFFVPLNDYYFVFLCLVSVLGWVQLRKKTPDIFVKKDIVVLLISIAVFWLLGLRRVMNSDTGLYHIPIIHWMEISALPIGLGNVHTRFGVWNFLFSVCGGVNAGNILPLSVYCMNIVLVGFASVDFCRWIYNKKDLAHYFAVAVFAYFSLLDLWYFSGGQKSPNADFAGMIFAIWVIPYFLERKEALTEWVRPAIILGGLAILTKLNGAPLVLVMLLAIDRSRRQIGKPLPLFMLGLVVSAGLLSLLKSFLVSGCLVFPAQATCAPVSWGIRKEDVLGTYSWVIRWARWPDGPADLVLHTWNWVPHWWSANSPNQIFFCTQWISILFVFLKLVFKTRVPKLDLAALLIALVGMAYWFFSAPDIRFGYGYFVTVFGILAGTLLRWVFENPKLLFLEKWFVRVMVAIVVVSAFAQVRRAPDLGMNTLIEPSPKYKVMKNVLNQSVYVPDENECWRLPVPCEPYYVSEVVETQFGIWSKYEDRRRSP